MNEEYELELVKAVLDVLTKAKDYNKADETFVKDMLMHHKEALKMAGKVLKSGKNADVAKLAESINKAQTKEIKAMEKWLKDNNIEGASAGHM